MSSAELQYLQKRNVAEHLAFLHNFLVDGATILDCGCGPGVLTNELAARQPKSKLVGIDSDGSMIVRARNQSPQNVSYERASIYSLPFEDSSFDVVYSNAVFQHLEQPLVALSEMRRVLKSTGVLAVRVPDWSGLLMHPSTEETRKAIKTFLSVHYGDKKDPFVGCKLPSYTMDAGLTLEPFSVSYEINDPKTMLTNIAGKLTEAGFTTDADSLIQASSAKGAIFVQSWCELVARKVK